MQTDPKVTVIARIIRLFCYSVVVLACFTGMRFYSGIYVDDEFGEHYWFVKHRPAWAFYFEPVLFNGDDDRDLDKLTAAQKAAHLEYREFVVNRRYHALIPPIFFDER